MNKKILLEQIDKEIKELKVELDKADKKDYLSQGILLGRINGLLTAQIMIINND